MCACVERVRKDGKHEVGTLRMDINIFQKDATLLMCFF